LLLLHDNNRGRGDQAAPVAQRQQHTRTHRALVTATDSLLTY